MQTAGPFIEDILEMMDAVHDDEQRQRVWDITRLELFDICRELSVAQLRTKTTLDLGSSSYSNGMLLPSDLLGIDMVRDDDDNEYFERDRSGIDPDEWAPRYYRYYPSVEPLVFGTDLGIANKGTSFTSPTLEAALVAGTLSTAIGEYVRFSDGLEYYRITSDTSPFSFTPTYYGPTISSGGDFAVRPPETQRLVVLDTAEDEVTDETMTVYYWKAPLGLYRDSDMIPLVSTKALMLRVLRRMPEAKEKRKVARGEIDEAMALLKRLNPSFPRPPHPRGAAGNPMNYNTNIFGDR